MNTQRQMNTQPQNNPFFIPFDSNKEQVTFQPTDWNSIFIPSLPSCFTDEQKLSYLIQDVFKLGSIKRVDIIKKENVNNRLMAFIHFNNWNNNESVLSFREKLNKDGLIDVFGFIDGNGFKKNYASLFHNFKNDLFLRILINKTPIKDTELNIHQLADLLEKAEQKIRDQEILIKQLQAESLDKQIHIDNLTVKLIDMEEKNNKITTVVHRIFKSEEDNVSEICNEFEITTKIEKPKLIRENYIDVEELSMNCYKYAESEYDSLSILS